MWGVTSWAGPARFCEAWDAPPAEAWVEMLTEPAGNKEGTVSGPQRRLLPGRASLTSLCTAERDLPSPTGGASGVGRVTLRCKLEAEGSQQGGSPARHPRAAPVVQVWVDVGTGMQACVFM